MRVIVTADFQLQFDNVDRCNIVAAKILSICKERKLEAIIIAGDLKQTYNPVDVRLIQWWLDFIELCIKKELQVLILLGNHDRLGLYSDNVNWLPVLQKAKAQVWWDQGRWDSPSGGTAWMLPFTGNEERWKRAIGYQNKEKIGDNDILIFHHDLAGSTNRRGVLWKGGIPVQELMPEKYNFCLGGHIHMPQRIHENVYYVGSPFPMDWSEVNHKKYFAVVIDNRLIWVPTGMPGWYDPDIKGFKPPASWEGTRIRIRVPVLKGQDYGAKMSEAKSVATIKYPGAFIHVTPEFDSVSDTQNDDPTAALSDSDEITQYVTQAMPKELAHLTPVMIRYIERKIQLTGRGTRESNSIRFDWVKAKNFLCFKLLDVKLVSKGIVVITGKNLDWHGSNGSGKSSLLSSIPVALFGTTFKGQSHDAWIRRGSEEGGSVELGFTTQDGRTVRVLRQRKPSEVRIWVNEQEYSSGSKSTDVGKQIQNICGFSWDTFASTVYLDQDEVGTFLFGTTKQRQEMISQLQNLERFGLALEIVKRESRKQDLLQSELTYEISILQERIQTQKQDNIATAELERIKSELKEAERRVASIKIPDKPTDEALREARNKVSKLSESIGVYQNAIRSLRKGLENENELIRDGMCSKCGQKINKKLMESNAIKVAAEIKSKESILDKKQTEYDLSTDAVDKEQQEFFSRIKQWQQTTFELQSAKEQCNRLLIEKNKWEKRVARVNKRDAKLIQQLKIMQDWLLVLQEDKQFLNTAINILSRDGLPSYMSQKIYPKLNKAAKYFSEIFSSGQIQVRFSLIEGEIDVEILNAHGGASIKDQSAGERKIAALIASFALREVGVKSNILILDEPGDGLDAANARAFAEGIKKLKDRFGTIYIITHNAAMQGELADENELVVTKQNGISTVAAR